VGARSADDGNSAGFGPMASTLRVLIIDDQLQVRDWIRDALADLDVRDVTEAADGRAALAIVTEPGAHFDVILCDLRMPERDGIETLRALAALGLDSAVIIMSVEDDRMIETAESLAQLQGLRSLGTISKPVTADKLRPLLAHVFDATPAAQREQVNAPEGELRGAFLRRELQLYYQPKIDLRSGAFAGVEALIRWKHPTLGMFQPGSFMPALESSDDYSALLADFSLEEGIGCAGRWLRDGRELRVAINLSAYAFDRLDLPERIEAIAKREQVPSYLITLEMTETQMVRSEIRALDVAMRLRLKGFHLSVDDFGIGQSGLAQLQKVPFTEMKIDREFVAGCATSTVKRSVVEASIALARTLKMKSVGEGVQNDQDLAVLTALGCDLGQGYLFAKPMSEEGLGVWAEHWAGGHT
jgi:EAL domain-containing protein (putative c-di-GMP-specific phosphodiesterase class I)/AmiR/NasT family two-component response regulator